MLLIGMYINSHCLLVLLLCTYVCMFVFHSRIHIPTSTTLLCFYTMMYSAVCVTALLRFGADTNQTIEYMIRYKFCMHSKI